MLFANWLFLIIVGVILLCIAWALSLPDAPRTPPVIRWICNVLGAIFVVIGLILMAITLAGVHT
jgi:hypothetical protein